MTETTTITAVTEVKDALARIVEMEQELARANDDLWHGPLRDMFEDLSFDEPVSWPCVDCGEPVIIRKAETLELVIRSGGHYGHGDC